ncbi:MAG: acyl-CoA thioesterase domain-containing protein [Henriciella sp.]
MSFWRPERSSETANHFTFNATPTACVGASDQQFLMGGVAMAAAIEAAIEVTGKPLLWATIQFVSGGALGDAVEIEVEHLGGGRNVAQVGASLSVGDRRLQYMSAALGGRAGYADQQFVQMPDVPPPEDCLPMPAHAMGNPENLVSRFERRAVFECSETGVEHLWIRPTFKTEMSASLLSIVSDFFLGAHVLSRAGTSLDNTLRIHALEPTNWILTSTHMAGTSNGTMFGTQHQFTQDGALLSTSSQTGLLPRRASK